MHRQAHLLRTSVCCRDFADVFQIKRQLTIIAHNVIDILEDASGDFCVRMFQLAALKEMKHLLRKWTLFNRLDVDERMCSGVFSTRLGICVLSKAGDFNASECCSGGGKWDTRLRCMYFTSYATCSTTIQWERLYLWAFAKANKNGLSSRVRSFFLMSLIDI